jgi:superfamily I DNA/RNA helicase
MAQPTAPSTPRVRRVLAGPGSGKTKLLTEQLRDRLAAGMAPASMLGLTFSRRAAREMQARLSRPAGRSPWLGTFHALAWRILSDAHSLPSAPDLDALIPQATRLLQAGTVPPWLPLVQYIAVDEAQDLDATQVEFLKALRHHMTTPELLLVGDPDQAIYGFRQASADYLLKAETTFAEPCKTTILAENHRSAKAIVEAARQILGPSADPQAPCHRLAATRPEAHPAIRWIIAPTPEGEATRIFEEIRTLLALNVPANSIAILMRTRAQTVPLEAEAAKWKLPVFSPPLHDQLEDGQEPPVPSPNAIWILTMHQSKGMEFTCVFLAGVQEGLVPHRRAVQHGEHQEELRLLYVAVTRAKQLLWFCRHGTPSPFLTSITTTTATPTPSRRQSWLHWLARYFQNGRAG